MSGRADSRALRFTGTPLKETQLKIAITGSTQDGKSATCRNSVTEFLRSVWVKNTGHSQRVRGVKRAQTLHGTATYADQLGWFWGVNVGIEDTNTYQNVGPM